MRHIAHGCTSNFLFAPFWTPPRDPVPLSRWNNAQGQAMLAYGSSANSPFVSQPLGWALRGLHLERGGWPGVEGSKGWRKEI